VAAPAMRGRLSRSSVLADYWALTKPDVNLLILITTAAGFLLARSIHVVGFPVFLLVHTLAGTLLVASGTATLNQYVDAGSTRKCGARNAVRWQREESSFRVLFGSASLFQYLAPSTWLRP
jgi:heme O synthase-like polyprenyltransferase